MDRFRECDVPWGFGWITDSRVRSGNFLLQRPCWVTERASCQTDLSTQYVPPRNSRFHLFNSDSYCAICPGPLGCGQSVEIHSQPWIQDRPLETNGPCSEDREELQNSSERTASLTEFLQTSSTSCLMSRSAGGSMEVLWWSSQVSNSVSRSVLLTATSSHMLSSKLSSSGLIWTGWEEGRSWRTQKTEGGGEENGAHLVLR